MLTHWALAEPLDFSLSPSLTHSIDHFKTLGSTRSRSRIKSTQINAPSFQPARGLLAPETASTARWQASGLARARRRRGGYRGYRRGLCARIKGEGLALVHLYGERSSTSMANTHEQIDRQTHAHAHAHAQAHKLHPTPKSTSLTFPPRTIQRRPIHHLLALG